MSSKRVFRIALLVALFVLMGCSSSPRETGITILSPPPEPKPTTTASSQPAPQPTQAPK